MGGLLLALLVVAITAPPAARAGTLAQFRTVFGDIEVELYDQDKLVTVQNFIHYAQSGVWSNMFLHRCDPNFVIQGGGFYVASRGATNQIISAVTNYGTIVNEFGAGRRFSNIYGTIAMAKRTGDTNSASSQWFINLADNSFLDALDTNNLFVVFGHVVGGTNVLNVFKTFNPASSTNTQVRCSCWAWCHKVGHTTLRQWVIAASSRCSARWMGNCGLQRRARSSRPRRSRRTTCSGPARPPRCSSGRRS